MKMRKGARTEPWAIEERKKQQMRLRREVGRNWSEIPEAKC